MIFGYHPQLPRSGFLYLPLVGMAGFVILYVIAAYYYPGGSWRSPEAIGFSFWNNYLCDLLDEYAINGELNTARFLARASLASLCLALLFLWFFLPSLFPGRGVNKKIMWISGILALVATGFLGAGTHDLTVRIAGILGTIAFISCFRELYRMGYIKLMFYGIICLLIFGANYYIYETGELIEQLPVIQKITFISFIGWFVTLNTLLIRKSLVR